MRYINLHFTYFTYLLYERTDDARTTYGDDTVLFAIRAPRDKNQTAC